MVGGVTEDGPVIRPVDFGEWIPLKWNFTFFLRSFFEPDERQIFEIQSILLHNDDSRPPFVVIASSITFSFSFLFFL